MIARKQARSQGSDEFPVAWQWLADLGVKPGEFQVETKARLALAMRSREWPEKQRVWACLSLATMGFNQELAVRMERGKVVPLTQTDIESQTGIAVRNVHRCVMELESEGWLKRVPVDEARGLRKGEVQIHCYAIPRPPRKPRAAAEDQAASGSEYDGLPDEVAYWLRHLKFHAPTADKLEALQVACQKLNEYRDVVRDICRPEPDQMPLPGISANSATVAKLKKGPEGKAARVVEMGLARGGQNEPLGLRAAPNDTCARVRPNKEEIKEIKKSAGRSVSVVDPATDRPTDNAVNLVKIAIEETGICTKLKDTPSRALLERITAKLAGHSPEGLKVRIHVRFESITGLGMIEGLAADVATADAEFGRRVEKELQERAVSEAKRLRSKARFLLDNADDCSEQDLDWARETLAAVPDLTEDETA